MIVSLSWLGEYVSVEMDVPSLAHALTMAGLEVDAVWDRYAWLETVPVGRVDDVQRHPNADKLTVCRVNIGDREVEVVCGAPNVRPGLFAPLALPGTVLPGGFKLVKTSIRGVKSHGMLCSEKELVLGEGKSGLMELDDSLTPGAPLNQALSLCDHVFEIGLTPNRADCLSIVGVAREVAAIQKTELKLPDFALENKGNDIAEMTSVTIQAPTHCPRYAARLLEDVKIGPSPFWMQDRLLSVGLRPINSIVDITNFVMLETGQPLHAFDFDRLAENRIVVRTASEGEPFVTLDGKERKLNSEMLMICDGEKPVAVGGVMGGENSEIQDDTTRVLIESAYFNPASIRKTAKTLGLSTDASHRFERGVDPEGTVNALNRAAALMAEISGGRHVPGLIDEHPVKTETRPIVLNMQHTNRLLGLSLDVSEMRRHLEAIDFAVEQIDDDTLQVQAPTYRVDVTRPQDLMEEIARLEGYDNIPTTYPLIPAQGREPSARWDFRGRVKGFMRGLGFTEVVNYSFIDEKSCDLLRLAEHDERRNLLAILNPLSEDQAVMRTSLMPGLMRNVHLNLAQQSKNLKVFEVGNTFISNGQDAQPTEKEYLACIWTGARNEHSFLEKDAECDFYDIKGAAEGLLNLLEIKEASFTRAPAGSCPYAAPGRVARILIGGKDAGIVGEVHPKVLSSFDLKQKAFVFELGLDALQEAMPGGKQYTPVPKFPSTDRDITIIVAKDIESGEVLSTVEAFEEPLVESVKLQDLFEGDPIPEGRKSLTLRITYRSAEQTLEDSDVTPVNQKIARGLMDKLGASLPG